MIEKTRERIIDILDASNEAMGYLADLSLESFLDDRKTLRACERCLEIVGEAAANIDDEFKKLHPDIPWDKAKGMRNLIIHEYHHVQYDVVHFTVTESLPSLIQSPEILVKELAL
jgi:uncharacterized protein with HEPN domain